jgi:hypothetical protein
MYVELTDDMWLAAGVAVVGAEAFAVDGDHQNVILATFDVRRNDPRSSEAGESATIKIMFEAAGALRLAAGINYAALGLVDENGESAAPSAAEPPGDRPAAPRTGLDDWMRATRLAETILGDDDDITAFRAESDRVVDGLAETMGVDLDRAALRAMAFTVAAIQALQMRGHPARPGEPGFDHATVACMGVLTDVVSRRLR